MLDGVAAVAMPGLAPWMLAVGSVLTYWAARRVASRARR